MTAPLSVPITVTTHVTGRTVSHTLELAQAAIVVTLDRDISTTHRNELAVTLHELLSLMDTVWSEIPQDGDVIVVDLVREARP